MLSRLDLPYNGSGIPACRLDLHEPDGACKAAYVYFHGGGLEAGDKGDPQRMIRALTDAGIAVASANYRMYPDAGYPEFLEDAADAAAWTYRHAVHRGEPVFVGGSSAGAYLAMMLCFGPWLARAGICPEDMAGFVFDAGQPTAHFNVLRERGTDPRRVVVDEAAPLYHVCDARPGKPLLFFVAEQDIPGRLEQNALLRRTLEHFEYPGDRIVWHLMQGYGHCAYCEDALPNGGYPYARHLLDFFDQALARA